MAIIVWLTSSLAIAPLRSSFAHCWEKPAFVDLRSFSLSPMNFLFDSNVKDAGYCNKEQLALTYPVRRALVNFARLIAS